MHPGFHSFLRLVSSREPRSAVLRDVFLLAGLLLPLSSAGCLYSAVPPEKRQTGVDLVGSNSSAAPIRVGVTKRPDVIATLGTPQRVSADGRSIGYAYSPVVGRRGYVGLGGPCGLCGYYPWEVHAHETLWLGFDENGILSRSASSRDHPAVQWETFRAQTTALPLPRSSSDPAAGEQCM
jgi:hypothetical protein